MSEQRTWTIMEPSTVPVQGMMSYPTEYSLPDGYFQDVQNLRWDDMSLRLRDGLASVVSSGPDTDTGTGGTQEGTFYGGAILPYGPTQQLALVAIEIASGYCGLYYNVYNGSTWGGWLEATADSGKWGRTRFATPTDGYCNFAPIPGTYGFSGVVVQNRVTTDQTVGGKSYVAGPRYFSIAGEARIIRAVEPPTGAQAYSAVAKPNDFIPVATAAIESLVANTHYNTGSTFTGTGSLTRQGSSGTYNWRWTTGTGGDAPAVNDYGYIATDANYLDLSGSKQLWVLATASDPTFLSCCKWEVVSNSTGTGYTVHDPTNFRDSHKSIPTTATPRFYAFPVGDALGGTVTDIDGIKITVTNAALAAGATLDVYGIFASGKVPGMAQHCVSFQHAGTKTDSPGVVLRVGAAADTTTRLASQQAQRYAGGISPTQYPTANTPHFRDLGVSTGIDASLPFDPTLYYVYSVPLFAPTSTEGGYGVDTYVLYRRDVGEDAFYYVNEATVVSYDAVTDNRWETSNSYFTGEQDWQERGTDLSDNTSADDKLFYKRAPDAFCEQVPLGGPMVYANGRLYVSGVRGSTTSTTRGSIKVSERDEPTRFRTVARFDNGDLDPDTGYMHSVADEDCTGMLAVSSSILGASTVYVWTNKALYAMDEFEIRKIANAGCVCPDTIAEGDGVTYWVDTDFVVRTLSGTVGEISRYTVHDTVLAVPAARRKYMSGSVWEGRYRLAHATATDNDNRKVLVYNPVLGSWESDDLLPDGKEAQKFIVWRFGGESKLVYFDPGGAIYHYEKSGQTTDDSDQIAFSIKSRAFHTPNFDKVRMFALQVVCDDKASETLSVVRTDPKDGGTETGTIDIDGSDSLIWRKDTVSSSKPGIQGHAIDYTLSGTLTAPFRIYGMRADWRIGGRGADA